QVKNNLITQYQGKHYKYDAQGNVIETSQSGQTLKLTWDNLNRLIQSDHNGQITSYGYDVFGRRLFKKNTTEDSLTLFGWDGDLMIWESQRSSKEEENYTKHYVYEPDSFVPLLQAGYTHFIQLIETPDYRQFQDVPYSIYKDPVWKTDTRKNKAELERVAFYHCDQVGTPQTLSNELGECIWEIKQDTWGTALEIKATEEDNPFGHSNIRFQGQYYDKETGLHYNRYRYYEPYSARYVSKDPIGLFGGLHSTKYVSDPNQWVDPMGLIGEHQKKDPFRERKGTTPLTKYVNERILKDKLDRQATEKEKRQAAKIFNEAINQQPVCEEQLIEYVTCSVGIGPKAIGFSINLYNGRVFKAEDAYSGTAVPVAVEKTMAMGAQSLKNVSKVLSKNALTAGASCVGGHIINKENPNNVSDNTDSFLTGKSYTFSVGASIFKG
ncbi:RHS repeat domain-containing protein, partial [Acinetobacter bereziniae]